MSGAAQGAVVQPPSTSQLEAQLAAPPQLSAQPVVQALMVQVAVDVQLSVQPPPGQSSLQAWAPVQSMLHEPPGQENCTFALSFAVTEQLPPPGQASSQVPPLKVQALPTQGSAPQAERAASESAAANMSARVLVIQGSNASASGPARGYRAAYGAETRMEPEVFTGRSEPGGGDGCRRARRSLAR